MSHSIYGAKRSTRLKIVVVGLLCATLVAGVGMAARGDHGDVASKTALVKKPSAPVSKAGQPLAVSSQPPPVW